MVVHLKLCYAYYYQDTHLWQHTLYCCYHHANIYSTTIVIVKINNGICEFLSLQISLNQKNRSIAKAADKNFKKSKFEHLHRKHE